jgi:tRNA dimethylallyltransferase
MIPPPVSAAGRRFFLARGTDEAEPPKGIPSPKPSSGNPCSRVIPQPFYLTGPTAIGKSALAIELARVLDGEIVNADAFQLYQGLDICTAKPSPADFAGLSHHLFGAIPLAETCDAQRYAELAQAAIAEILQRHRLPIVTGGSGLYVKSLTHGLAPLPSSQSLRDKLCHLTCNERIEWLLIRDKRAPENVNLRNDRRVTRALEICLLTGLPQSELRRAWQEKAPAYRGVQLVMERSMLNARIERRVLQMINSGLVEEIRSLPPLSPTAEKAIGIREIRAHLRGELTLPEAVSAIQTATRQYARRQEKWFKRETGLKPVVVSDTESVEAIRDRVLAALPELKSTRA